jgi:hypothetical protein
MVKGTINKELATEIPFAKKESTIFLTASFERPDEFEILSINKLTVLII